MKCRPTRVHLGLQVIAHACLCKAGSQTLNLDPWQHLHDGGFASFTVPKSWSPRSDVKPQPQALLGCAMPGGGKGAVMKCIGGTGRLGVGTVEWGGAEADGGGGVLALFVNVQGSRYSNEFYRGGQEMSWFGTKGQCGHGVLKLVIDALKEGRGGQVEGVKVLLFCRLAGQPYVFLGGEEAPLLPNPKCLAQSLTPKP